MYSKLSASDYNIVSTSHPSNLPNSNIFYIQKTCNDGTRLTMRFVTHPEYVWIENMSPDTNVEVKGKNWKHTRVFDADSLENFVVSYAREIWDCMVEDGWRYVK